MMIPGGYRVPPFAKGRLGGISPLAWRVSLAKSPPAPLFQRGGTAHSGMVFVGNYLKELDYKHEAKQPPVP